MGVRTDLALESHDNARGQSGEELPGIAVEESSAAQGIAITRVEVLDERGEKAIGRSRGKYITLESPALAQDDPDLHESMAEALYQELKELIGDAKPPYLVVGLGNRSVTADALGSDVVERIMVTRHVIEYLPGGYGRTLNPVAAIAPGVLGVTGIETGEVIKSLAERLKPGLIIAIDALAAHKASRIGTTVQISDAGIEPGSGIGGKRMPLSKQTLGVPVIALGVPMVVHASNIVLDAVEALLEDQKIEPDQSRSFVEQMQKLLSAQVGDLVVTPKEIDALVRDLSRILALGINRALHRGLRPQEVQRFFMA